MVVDEPQVGDAGASMPQQRQTCEKPALTAPRSAAVSVKRVDDEVENLRVEKVHPVILGLEITCTLYITMPEDIEPLSNTLRAARAISMGVASRSSFRSLS
jgi:hypothetical protein